VDPLSARATLHLDPTLPLTPSLIEHAFERERMASHPSRFPEPAQRAQAEQWTATIDAARAALLAELASAGVPGGVQPWAPAASPTRLARGGLIALVASGAALLFIGLAVAAGFAAASLGQQAGRAIEQAASEHADEMVDRYQSGETLFTFPAALEFYYDGRFQYECPSDVEAGCWEAAVFTESDCDAMTVAVGYSNSRTAVEPDDIEMIELSDVLAYDQTHFVFGNDDYAYGWVMDVVCHDQSA
jgi:hypothetical protein